MSYLRKAWITGNDRAELYSISFASEQVNEEYNRIKVNQNTFPAEPTPENPLRHTIVLSYFTQDDLNRLAQVLDRHRTDF